MAAVSQLRPPTVYVARSDHPPTGTAHSTLASTSHGSSHTAAARANATASTPNGAHGLGAGVSIDKQASKATPNSTLSDTLGTFSTARTSSKVPTTVTRPGGALRRPQRVVPAAAQASDSGGHKGPTARTPSTPGRARRTVKPTSATDENQNEHFKLPSLAKSTTRTPSRVQRRLSQTSSSTTGSRDLAATTDRPDWRIGSPSATPQRKADALATLSTSALAASTSSSRLNDSVRASARSVNALNASTRTPLRASTSTSRSRTPSTALSASTRVRPTATVPREANSRTAIPSTAIRKKPGTQSAIPIPTTVRNDARTLSRPTSSAGTAALAPLSAAAPSRPVSSGRRQQEQQAGLGVGGAGRRPSGTSALGASQSSRKSSWETVRSARNSLASSRRRSSIVRAGIEGKDQMKTPRRPSAPVGPATLVSPPSPAQESARTDLEGQMSPTSDPTELFNSHAAFLSPLPPPPPAVDLLLPSQGQGSKTRSRTRESTSLEEILRLGMLNQSLARRADGPSLELELLLDEGTSRVMTDELRNSLGSAAGGAARQGGRDSPAGPNTPWRGRVVSLGASARRRSVASSAAVSGLDPLAEDGSSSHVTSSSPPRQNGQVLLLRQSTAEASDLRRQVAALSAELERLKGQQQTETTSLVADRQLLDDLEAARRREVELRADWEAERQAMEEDMAELAAAASSSTRELTPPPPPPLAVALEPIQQSNPSERLHQRAEICAGASTRLAATCSEVEALAKREREDGRLAIASLQAIARGLEVWGTVLE